MKTNPRPNDDKKSYRTSGFFVDTKDSFGRKRKGWIIDPTDEDNIRKEYENSKIIKNDDSADQDES